MRRQKSAVVCMVYNSHEYLAEFIVYYKKLVDHIYLIDHKSNCDFRDICDDQLTVVRSNQVAQFQSECTNIVIEHFQIKKRYDWLFVLDVDEFLPFKSSEDFQEYLTRNRGECVLKLPWKNGVPEHFDRCFKPYSSLIDVKNDIKFFDKPSYQYKSFVNIRKTKGRFFVPTGAHIIGRKLGFLRSIVPVLKNRKFYIGKETGHLLYHVVALDKHAFVKKIKNYLLQLEYRSHVAKQGGGIVSGYPESFDGDDWLWYIANFRVSDERLHYQDVISSFQKEDIFSELSSEAVASLKLRISSLDRVDEQAANDAETYYLANKKDDSAVLENIKWFYIDENLEIQIRNARL